MISFDEFSIIAAQETRQLPAYVFDQLSGGVLADEHAYLHPARAADDLYILGTYTVSGMGRQVVLYYGSFAAVLGNSSRETWRERVRAVLRHEFRHHLETSAGEFGKDSLIEEDRESMRRYYMMHAERQSIRNKRKKKIRG